MNRKQIIAVFQQNGSGESKIKGIERHGSGRFELVRYHIDDPLPPVVDDGRRYLPDTLAADLVLDYLTHPDLSYDLAALCRQSGIPLVASGKKIGQKGVFTPPTCCGLVRQDSLGEYGKRFGAPDLEVQCVNGRVAQIDVVRGAPCGATWEAAARVIGLSADQAAVRIGLDVQYFCSANPAGWDPIHGKSPVHFAGKVHSAALKRALDKDGKCGVPQKSIENE